MCPSLFLFLFTNQTEKENIAIKMKITILGQIRNCESVNSERNLINQSDSSVHLCNTYVTVHKAAS